VIAFELERSNRKTMIAVPYYFLAGGIALVIAGFFIAAASRASQPPRRPISSKMRDAEIAQRLRNENRIRLHSVVFAAGMLCILISLVWRMARLLHPQ
jgi:hypothetical protein